MSVSKAKWRLLVLCGASVMGICDVASAQMTPRPYVAMRGDVITGIGTAVQAGGGGDFPMGYYVRTSLVGAAGVTLHAGDTQASGRVDVLARFLLDPFREMPWGLSLGGGVSVPIVEGRRVRPYLTVIADLEGPRKGAYSPAVQVGLGGGARVGLVLRRSTGRWR